MVCPDRVTRDIGPPLGKTLELALRGQYRGQSYSPSTDSSDRDLAGMLTLLSVEAKQSMDPT